MFEKQILQFFKFDHLSLLPSKNTDDVISSQYIWWRQTIWFKFVFEKITWSPLDITACTYLMTSPRKSKRWIFAQFSHNSSKSLARHSRDSKERFSCHEFSGKAFIYTFISSWIQCDKTGKNTHQAISTFPRPHRHSVSTFHRFSHVWRAVFLKILGKFANWVPA